MNTVLALDTATEAMSLALRAGGRVRHRFVEAGRRHSELLMPAVRALLGEAGCRVGDLDAIVCGVGPGSFVGVRVGVSFAKGLAAPGAIPVAPVGSLALIAEGARAAGAGERVAVAIDARMGQVYLAAYDFRRLEAPERIGPQVLPPEAVELPAGEGGWTCVGTGFAAYPELLSRCGRRAAGVPDLPDVRHALAMLDDGRLVAAEPAALEPVYTRNRVALTLEERRRRATLGSSEDTP